MWRKNCLLLGAMLVIGIPVTLCETPQHELLSNPANWTVYHYDMTGKIRLLLFWIGKENVGGGHIRILNPHLHIGEGESIEAVEVLFGSIPERVPGRINRWGYGKEWAIWNVPDSANSQQRVLLRSFFQGYMRHSSEDNIAEVQSAEKEAQSGREFWYDGILCSVLPNESYSSVHKFLMEEDFDYRHPDSVEKSYTKRVAAGPPDYYRRIDNASMKVYDHPFGFLTALRQMIFGLTADFETLSQDDWKQQRLNHDYAYNGLVYQLSLKDVHYHSKFKTSSRTIAPASQLSTYTEDQTIRVDDVAEADFSVYNKKKNQHHNFTIIFPLKGEFQGIPLKIIYKPRWWLKIELNLN